MAKIQAAMNRLFKNVFICKNCSTKMRAESVKVIEGKVRCRKCARKAFRPIRKK